MRKFIKNLTSIIAGLLIGGTCNLFLLRINGGVIPLPSGADLSTPEGLASSIALFNPIHFLAPFLAHAIGTLVAAFVTIKLAATKSWSIARIPGILFFMAGVFMVHSLHAPLWFEVIDLSLAYLPMAWLGFLLARPKL